VEELEGHLLIYFFLVKFLSHDRLSGKSEGERKRERGRGTENEKQERKKSERRSFLTARGFFLRPFVDQIDESSHSLLSKLRKPPLLRSDSLTGAKISVSTASPRQAKKRELSLAGKSLRKDERR
jgi:hypothetical protein